MSKLHYEAGSGKSPTPAQVLMTFSGATAAMQDGKHVTRKEWADPDIYGLLSDGRLKIHLKDGSYHDWIISDGDLAGEDWYVLP